MDWSSQIYANTDHLIIESALCNLIQQGLSHCVLVGEGYDNHQFCHYYS
jgi:hypothetical protein